MQRYIALLRGVNVSGHNMIKITELKQELENLGFENVVTYLQSGNVVFDAPTDASTTITSDIYAMIREIFELTAPVIIKTSKQLTEIIAANPFLERPDVDQTWLYVTFLDEQPGPGIIDPPAGTTDECQLSGDVVYLYCPKGYGKTKLNNNWFERKLGAVATTRNWKTTLALSELAKS